MSELKILEQARFAQVALVVRDIHRAVENYALLFGCEPVPLQSGGDYRVTQTRYFGEAAPEAKCRLAFFTLSDGVQLELIEPNEAPSVWRDHLEKYGEGIHHIAFTVEDMDETLAACSALGMIVEQTGYYGDGSGRYAYLDARERLKCRVELLQNFRL